VEGDAVAEVAEAEAGDQFEILVDSGVVVGLLELVHPPAIYDRRAALDPAGEDEATVELEFVARQSCQCDPVRAS
jgi:hypothetical protein